MTGTWAGDWGSSATQRTHITLVMNWDGQKATGILDPGPNSTPAKEIVLDVTNWTVRIEADAKDASGNPVHILAEGRLEDLGSPHRRIVGTWHRGAASGAFTITRD